MVRAARVLISAPNDGVHACERLLSSKFRRVCTLSALLFDTPMRIVRSAARWKTVSSYSVYVPLAGYVQGASLLSGPHAAQQTLCNRTIGNLPRNRQTPRAVFATEPGAALPHLDHLASSTTSLRMASVAFMTARGTSTRSWVPTTAFGVAASERALTGGVSVGMCRRQACRAQIDTIWHPPRS
ncbi:hypothetical protein C8J57DRAFT_165313 [Mycena rebaudengoi]|nr:hypothetical protein C8J57DRAFT_165313 [Mycena rebaudengoi]